MKIARVTAHALNPPVPIKAPGIDRTVNRPIVFVEVETDAGIVGHGITSLAPAKGAAALIANTVTPLILGMDARRIADVWNAMYRELCHRGQTGLAYHAISAIDIALWDIRGKALKEPVWRLLGGARDKVPCYVTMGLPSMDREQLASVAKHWVAQGFGGVKMVVGVIARDRAHEFPNMTEALLRGRPSRQSGARRGRPQHRDRDRHQLRDRSLAGAGAGEDVRGLRPCLRRGAGAGQRSRAAWPTSAARPACRSRPGRAWARSTASTSCWRSEAVDILQPNVVNCGGYTGGLRVADMALGFATPICNGGGSTQHNLHLQAGAVNGTICEWHPYQSAGAVAVICPSAPTPKNGILDADRRAGAGLRSRPGGAEGIRLARTRGAARCSAAPSLIAVTAICHRRRLRRSPIRSPISTRAGR